MKQVASEIDVKPGTVAFHRVSNDGDVEHHNQCRAFGIRAQTPNDSASASDQEPITAPRSARCSTYPSARFRAILLLDDLSAANGDPVTLH